MIVLERQCREAKLFGYMMAKRDNSQVELPTNSTEFWFMVYMFRFILGLASMSLLAMVMIAIAWAIGPAENPADGITKPEMLIGAFGGFLFAATMYGIVMVLYPWGVRMMGKEYRKLSGKKSEEIMWIY